MVWLFDILFRRFFQKTSTILEDSSRISYPRAVPEVREEILNFGSEKCGGFLVAEFCQCFSVATPPEPRGEIKLFFVQISGSGLKNF